jgi:hypothetical protein
MKCERIAPKIMVAQPPPMKPSQVFLGDSLISGVRPHIVPKTYAMTSLQIIMDTGTMNQIKPSNKF